jgi:hypothetical protein
VGVPVGVPTSGDPDYLAAWKRLMSLAVTGEEARRFIAGVREALDA